METNVKKVPLYKKWWFWMSIVFVVFCVLCLATKGSAADSGTKEISIDLDEIVEGFLNLDNSIKSINAEFYEAEYGITYFEGTEGKAFYEELCDAAGGEDFTDSYEEDGLQIYINSNDVYYIYVESDITTDEIHYFQISIMDWEEAGGSADIFLTAAELLGYDHIFNDEDDFTMDDYTESLQEFCEQYEEGLDCSSTIIGASTCISFFTDTYDWPTCEIFAYDAGQEI